MGVPGACRPRRRVSKSKFVVPYIMRPLRNFDKVYPVFTITYLNDTTRRAWLVPPEVDGQVVTIRLLSVQQELGCCEGPQSVTVETSLVQAGYPIPQDTPVTFRVFNPAAGDFFVGCVEGEGGRVVYSTTPCYTTGASDSWWAIEAKYWTTRQPNVRTGTPLVAHTISTNRVLRALATRDPNVFQLGFVPVEDNVGLDLSFVLASAETCPPCSAVADVVDIGPCFDPVTGAAL